MSIPIPILSIASIIAAATLTAIVIFLSANSVKRVKNELKDIKDLLLQVSNGTFDGDNAPPHIKESADILKALKRIAGDVKQQQQAVSHYAYTDDLTGLANKRRFDEELIRCFDFAKRGLPVCIVTMELTNIKKINNEVGSATGDKVLKLMAEILKKTVRKTDLSARLGSDEFAIVLPNMENNAIRDWLSKLSAYFIKEQKKDNLLPENHICNIRFGYSFVKRETDRDPSQVFDRSTQALARTDAGSNIIVMEG